MVKRKLLVMAAAMAAAVLWPLGAPEGAPAQAETLEFPGTAAPTAASLAVTGGRVYVVFADLATTSLELFELPAATALPSTAPPPSFVDRIDVAPPLAATFGAHAVGVAPSGAVELLYVDRERDEQTLLKRVTRPAGSSDWLLALEAPVGLPLAVVPLGRSVFASFWEARGTLLARLGSAPLVVRQAFALVGRTVSLPADAASPPAFLASDRASGSLLVVSPPSGQPMVRKVTASADAYAAVRTPQGGLAVATWDRERKRIMLEETQGSASPRETVVAPSDGVSSLALAASPAGWVFVFDEVVPAPLGRWTHGLSMLVPGRPRYRKLVLSRGLDPVRLFRTCEVDGWLYVLEIRDKARLLRTRIP